MKVLAAWQATPLRRERAWPGSSASTSCRISQECKQGCRPCWAPMLPSVLDVWARHCRSVLRGQSLGQDGSWQYALSIRARPRRCDAATWIWLTCHIMIKNRKTFCGLASGSSGRAAAQHRLSYPPDRASGASDPKAIFGQTAPISGFGPARASARLGALVLRSKREALGSHPNLCYGFDV